MRRFERVVALPGSKISDFPQPNQYLGHTPNHRKTLAFGTALGVLGTAGLQDTVCAKFCPQVGRFGSRAVR